MLMDGQLPRMANTKERQAHSGVPRTYRGSFLPWGLELFPAFCPYAPDGARCKAKGKEREEEQKK